MSQFAVEKEALIVLFLISCLGLNCLAEEPDYFSIAGVKIGVQRQDLEQRLGLAEKSSNDTIQYVKKRLRVGFSFTNPTLVNSVAGERDLEFGGKTIAKIGSSITEIHKVLGEPERVREDKLSRVRNRTDFYDRFRVRVFYKNGNSAQEYRVVMFMIVSDELERFLETDPAER